MVKQKKASGVPKEVVTKEDVRKLTEEIVKLPGRTPGLPGNVMSLYIVSLDPVHSAGLMAAFPAHGFHVISEGLIDQLRLLVEGQSGIIDRLDRMEKENERQHSETRALVKISFSELDRRVSDLESQVKDLQEWKKQVQSRLQS
jgi:hypothetical protein